MVNLDRFSHPMSWEWKRVVDDDLPFTDDLFQRAWMYIEDFYDEHGELPDIFDVAEEIDSFADDIRPIFEEARDVLCKHSKNSKSNVTT